MEQLNDVSFQSKVANNDGAVVVDFFADWCGPCKRLAPMFEELSSEVAGANFYKVDVENAQDLAMKFGVQSIPTIIIFKGGEPVERIVGVMPKDELKKVIEQHAGTSSAAKAA